MAYLENESKENLGNLAHQMHVFTDSKVALWDAVIRPSNRLSSWELFNLAEKDRALKAELDRQRAKPKKQQQEITYERWCDSGW